MPKRETPNGQPGQTDKPREDGPQWIKELENNPRFVKCKGPWKGIVILGARPWVPKSHGDQ